MKNTRTFHFYADPGHGWLKTTRKLLEKLGIAKIISEFSYQRNGDVFLEEDRDAFLLVKKLQDLGIKSVFHSHVSNKRSKIRSYESFLP